MHQQKQNQVGSFQADGFEYLIIFTKRLLEKSCNITGPEDIFPGVLTFLGMILVQNWQNKHTKTRSNVDVLKFIFKNVNKASDLEKRKTDSWEDHLTAAVESVGPEPGPLPSPTV